MKFHLAIILASLTFGAFSALAQDYPYDDKSETPKSAAPELPLESPGPKKKSRSVMRVGLKAGGNFAYAQGTDTVTGAITSVSGMGVEGAVSLGWDLAYQPVFIEIEGAYRGLMITTSSKIHFIPLRVGLFYRDRLSETSFWKPGITSGMAMRVQKTDFNENEFVVIPIFGFSSIFEFDNFLIELTANINRIESHNNFFDFGFRGGFRF